MQFKTLIDALEHNKSETRFVGFINGQQEEKTVTFSALYERALGLLYVLQSKGMKQGDYLILFLNNNEQMIDVFWACQLGGIIPVPLAVGISDQHRIKVINVANSLGATAYLYTDRKILQKLNATSLSQKQQNDLKQLQSNTILIEEIVDLSSKGLVAEIGPEDISFIQFSSGSTGSPKGVVLRHRNLIANIEGIKAGANFTQDDISLSWMPLTHDMGLIGFHLNPVVCNYSHYIMRTDLFVRRPLYWLIAASDKKANVLCSPNFGYKHFLNAYLRRGIEQADLSHIRLIFNGAEPISVALCEQFNQEMKKFGLPATAMFPVYGLAEASLAVSFPEVGSELNVKHARRDSLAIGDSVVLQEEGEDTVTLVAVGKPIPNSKVRISDAKGDALSDNSVGHIHIGGTNITEEIIGEDGSSFYENGWLDTGDLGFVSSSELFITGRYKEIIFVNGQNYYPYDLEECLYEIEGLELGKVVAVGATSKESDLEQLIIFLLHKGDVDSFKPMVAEVTTRISELFGIEVHHVLPIKKVPKTTSGKVQRSALAKEYEADGFRDVIQSLSNDKSVEVSNSGSEESEEDEIIRAVRQVCKEALPDKTFSIQDSLLELGASSLALVEIHAGLEEMFPGKIEITDLVDHPTIEQLAAFLRN